MDVTRFYIKKISIHLDANLYLLLLKKKIKFDFKPLDNKIWLLNNA